MNADEFAELLHQLRTLGSDTTHIEVKAAAGGLPSTIGDSLCALSNLPGGGWIILGLDERAGFTPVRLPDPPVLAQGLADKARLCSPPVMLEVEIRDLDGDLIVLARVHETVTSDKPCRIGGHGWIRLADGDYQMSQLEEQAFLANRDQPRFDRQPVAGSRFDDLDPQLVRSWLEVAREMNPGVFSRFSDEQALVKVGIITEDRIPTVAGLLALGIYPQQFFPRYVLSMAAAPTAADPTGSRAIEPVALSGPIPSLLEEGLAWTHKLMTRSVVHVGEGNVVDQWTFPPEAIRELLTNALVHRDLAPWSEGMAVEVRLAPDRLTITNPGGLYGITVDRLGLEGLTSARNPHLLEICRYTRTPKQRRLVEALASGIPTVLETLSAAGKPLPIFQDAGIRFTVILRRNSGIPPAWLNDTERLVFTHLSTAGQETTVAQIAHHTGLQAPTIRRALRTLTTAGLAQQIGGQGKRGTTYRLSG